MKKGFTLVELIGVVIILGILALLAFPPMLNMIKNSQNEKLEAAKEIVLSSAKEYVQNNINDFPERDGNVFCIELGKIVDQKFIKNSLEGMDENTKIEVAYINGKFEYKFSQNNQCTQNLTVANADKSGANKPVIESKLIPVKWNGTAWQKADSDNSKGADQWYDYSSQMWANAVITNTDKYVNAPIGSIIPENDIMQYFVWIPRFEYKYTNLGNQYAGGSQYNPGKIAVNFISSNVTKSTNNEYKVHPAFSYVDQQLSGFWIAKFETSGNSSYIKPNQTIIPVETIDNYKPTYIVNYYSNNAEIHYINNREWGAVAYLSQSKYGKQGNPNFTGENKQIFTNSYIGGEVISGSSNSVTSISGCSGGSPNAKSNTKCPYTYDIDYYGTGASTTGTIYGVYDMAGGKREFVLANFKVTPSNSLTASKYSDLFTNSIANTACDNNICYGQGLSEMTGWYNNEVLIPTASSLFLFRGNSAINFNGNIWNTTTGGVGAADFPTVILEKDNIIMTTSFNNKNLTFPSNLINTKPSKIVDENIYLIKDYYATRTVIFR